jgi:hypothetical protein
MTLIKLVTVFEHAVVFFLSCTSFMWAVQLHWLDILLAIYVTDQDIDFLVPDSCRATVKNGNSISKDMNRGHHIENYYNDTCFLQFSGHFGSCFWHFDIAGYTQYMYIVGKFKINLHSL